VTDALNGEATFVEDLFFGLLNRLGITTNNIAKPTRPTIVQVLQSLLGRRLDAVRTASHRPARGERRAFPRMSDLRLDFTGGLSVTACGCGEDFELRPTPPSDDSGAASPPADVSYASEVSEVAGRELTDAATVRHGYFPDLRGVVLRFGDTAVFIAAVEGRWTVANGSGAPAQMNGGDELRVNRWLVG
jgi:hypothetical protein